MGLVTGQESTKNRQDGGRKFPFGSFWLILVLVCLALGLSAAYSYWTLTALRGQYLENRGYAVVTAAEHEARGPGRYRNPEVWQAILERSVERNLDLVAQLSLLDDQDKVLAAAGAPPEENQSVYLFRVPLESGRGRGWGRGPGTNGSDWHIEVSLFAAGADFIRRQAQVQVLTAGIAIAMLLGLGLYLTRTLKHFLLLKDREESERHLASLGALSATLAHEIRNPLGAMKGLTQLVQEDLSHEHRAQEHLKTVVAEAERLERLVSDLLVFARPGELRLVEFDLAKVVREVADLLVPQAAGLGVGINVSGLKPTPLTSDRDGLRQVFLNLILNAVEAAAVQESGRVDVTVFVKGHEIEVAVEDNGPGLGSKNPADLFLPFETGKTKGSGLGLAVSKRIVERIGGLILLSEKKEGGVRCLVRIPKKSQLQTDQPGSH